jgi:ribosomal protein S18 acetylase RimI-like enzyme
MLVQPTFRRYQTEDDYWRMRAFLRHVFLLNNQRATSWHVARLDYARWHSCLNCAHVQLQEVAWLWELDDQLIGILMPDGGPGEAHLLAHPLLRTLELEESMLSVAEERLVATAAGATGQLCVWAPARDRLRQSILLRHGYAKDQPAEVQWRRQLAEDIPAAPITPGYTIRSLGDGLELLERCYASGLGFHAGDIRVAVDNRADPTWYRNIQTAPLYRRDLDLVAVAPDGAIAAFCTVWFDDVTRSGYFEPVATVPAHQRRGLARALMTEGLRRLQRIGATVAFVSGYSPAANALYQSVMGNDYELYEPWMTRWPR